MLGTSKHILVFSPLYPPHIGGLERHAQQWNEAMAAAGHQITVWTPQLTPTTPAQEHEGVVEVIRYPAWEIVANYPVPKFWRPLFWRQLQHLQATLVVSRTRFFLPTLMALLFAHVRHLPYLHIEHGSDFVHSRNPAIRLIARLYDYLLGRVVLRQATMVVANSKASAEFTKRLSGRAANAVIYRGVDTDTIESVAPATAPRDDVLLITYVGRLMSGKGVHDLLAALSLIKKRILERLGYRRWARAAAVTATGSAPCHRQPRTLFGRDGLEEHGRTH